MPSKLLSSKTNLLADSMQADHATPSSAPRSALTLRAHRPQQVLGDAYLRFQLLVDVFALLPMGKIQEVISLPAPRLAPMPNMPSCVLGLMNRRSQVVWVVDLAQLLGLPTTNSSVRDYHLILIRTGTVREGQSISSSSLALSVQQIKGNSWVKPDLIQPTPSQVSPMLQPYLRGCIFQDTELSLIFDAEAIANSSALHNAV